MGKRKKKNFDMRKVKICLCYGKRRVPRHHHTLCDKCWEEQYPGKKESGIF